MSDPSCLPESNEPAGDKFYSMQSMLGCLSSEGWFLGTVFHSAPESHLSSHLLSFVYLRYLDTYSTPPTPIPALILTTYIQSSDLLRCNLSGSFPWLSRISDVSFCNNCMKHVEFCAVFHNCLLILSLWSECKGYVCHMHHYIQSRIYHHSVCICSMIEFSSNPMVQNARKCKT